MPFLLRQYNLFLSLTQHLQLLALLAARVTLA
jgi:hypothetical protein